MGVPGLPESGLIGPGGLCAHRAVPCDVHEASLTESELSPPDGTERDRAARLAIDRDHAGKCYSSVRGPDVKQISLMRIAREVDHVEMARVIRRDLRLQAVLRNASHTDSLFRGCLRCGGEFSQSQPICKRRLSPGHHSPGESIMILTLAQAQRVRQTFCVVSE
jgi:hypothetical protein